MPVPILPVNVRKNDDGGGPFQEGSDYVGINVDLLQGIVTTQSKRATKVSDSDASLLFRFWQEGKTVKQGSSESVQVPERFSNSDVLRLKALGFVVGDDTKVVKLTARAKEVVKTIVLSEENALDSVRVSKPYNEILADAEKKSGSIRLALDELK